MRELTPEEEAGYRAEREKFMREHEDARTLTYYLNEIGIPAFLSTHPAFIFAGTTFIHGSMKVGVPTKERPPYEEIAKNLKDGFIAKLNEICNPAHVYVHSLVRLIALPEENAYKLIYTTIDLSTKPASRPVYCWESMP